jgi:hypothetical protein
MGSTFYTNQFGQQVAVGDADLGIVQTGSLAGIVSPNQASPAVTIPAGAPAKIDTTITSGYIVNFLQAGITDVAIGTFKRTSTAGTFALLQQVEVAIFGGPVVWLLANATITPGQTVYQDTNNLVVGTGGGAKSRGIALDYAVAGQVLRVLLVSAVGISA